MKRLLSIFLISAMLINSSSISVLADEIIRNETVRNKSLVSENAIDEAFINKNDSIEEEKYAQTVTMTLDQYNKKMNAFINDSRWCVGASYYNYKPGIPYVSNNGSREANKDPTGCWAYAQDFIKYVYDIDDNYIHAGERYTNVSEIRTGDVVRMTPNHTLVVLRRDGNTLYTADGGRNEEITPTTNNVKIGTSEYSVNKQICNWGYFLEGYHFLNISGSPSQVSCSVSPSLAKSSINIGETCIVSGSVSSCGSPIATLSAGIYTDKSGNNCVNGIYKEAVVNSYNYNLSRIDNDIHFERISSGGTYYFVVKALLSNGKEYSNCASFNVNGNTCSAPDISVSDINGGKQIKITKGSSDTVNYTIKKNGTVISNGNSSSNPYTINLTEEGEYSVIAYSSRSGYTNSGTSNKTTKLTKAVAPEIVQNMTESGVALTIKSDISGATIYYTTNGNEPTTNSNKFTGSLLLTEAKTVKAFVAKNGYINSDIANVEVKLSEPDAPTNVKLTCDEKIPVGEAATITWDSNVMATSYTAELYLNNTKVDSYTTSGKTASFILNDAGIYTIKIYASNFVGNSFEAEDVISVEAKSPSLVRFLDWDGQVINSQEVVYGHDATIPESPERKGYTFIAWDKVNELTAIKENVDVNATYKINTYAVRFYDASGKQVGSTQKVEYMKSANAPVDSLTDIPTGYILAGWRVIESSNDSDGDYTKIDSDMKLQAVYCWENQDLPIIAEVTSAKFDTNTSNYKVDVKLTNYPDSATTAILRVSLKTAEGKMVKSTKQEIDVLANESVDKSVTLKYSGKATNVSVVLLGVKGDDLTGSAYSKEVTKEISYLSDTTWTDWSEWSTDEIKTSDNNEVETVTEYRYKDKQTTSGSNSSMSGWTLYDTKSNWGSWGSWSSWSPSSQSGSDSKQVESRTEWRYYYFYCPVCGGREPFQGTSDCHKYSLTGGNWNEKWFPNAYNSVASSTFSYSSAKRYTYSLDGNLWIFTSSNINDTAPGTKDGGYGDPVIRTAYRYRTRSKVNTYYFFKWSDWSPWDTTEYSSNDNRQVETRTLYRYRDKVEINDDRAEKIEESGIKHSVSGNIVINTDLSGKVATVMVYKGKNTDPNEDQIQYVGQTQFGENNSYNFDVIPKSEPNQLTGDFTVCLGIEGSTGLINVGIIAASHRNYKVEYLDIDGTVISSQEISEGGNAIVPSSPKKDGHIFVGWSTNSTNVQEDLSITAVYAPLTYTVAFVDAANGAVSFDSYNYGEKIVVPVNPTSQGKIFKGWDCVLNNTEYVFENRVVSAVYEPITYTVTFVDENNNTVKKETVEYGKSANPPIGIIVEGKSFQGWSTEKEWWYVTEDIIVKPVLMYAETVSEPSYEIVQNDGSVAIYLTTETKDADIYYSIIDGEDEAEIIKYTGPVVIDNLECEVSETAEENSEIVLKYKTNMKAFATYNGMNDSDNVNIDYLYDEIVDLSAKPQYKVWFDGNGADYIDYSSKLVSIDDVYGNLPTPEREGYYFQGWYTGENDGIKVSESDIVKDEYCVLYARWSTKSSEVTPSEGFVVDGIQDMTYTGTAIKQNIQVYYNGQVLSESDYGVSYKNNTNVGTATVIITGKGSLAGKKEVTFAIERKNLSDDDIVAPDITFKEDNKSHKVSPVVTYLGKALKKTDYSIEYGEGDYKKAGSYVIKLTGNGNYTGTKDIKLDIFADAMPISKAKIDNIPDQKYNNGNVVTISSNLLKVTYEGNLLSVGTDYSVVYSNNKNKGIAKVHIIGIGKYAGSKTVNFRIKQRALSDAMVLNKLEIKSYEYVKGGCKPEFVLGYEGNTLRKNTDYSIIYKNNNKVGNAVAVITGKGNYNGKLEIPFEIAQKSLNSFEIGVSDANLNGTIRVADVLYVNKANKYAAKPVVTDVNGNELKLNTDYKIKEYKLDGNILTKNSKPEVNSEIEMTIEGKGCYTGTAYIKYTLRSSSLASAVFNIKSQTFTGSEISISKESFTKAEIKVKENGTMVTKQLEFGKDFEIIGYRNNVKKGTATVIIKGLGNYAGEKLVKFNINAAKMD